MKPTRFRKRPVEVVALKWTGRNWEDMKKFCSSAQLAGNHLVIPTLEGQLTAEVGNYIVRGLTGEFYPVREDIFIASYEPI